MSKWQTEIESKFKLTELFNCEFHFNGRPEGWSLISYLKIIACLWCDEDPTGLQAMERTDKQQRIQVQASAMWSIMLARRPHGWIDFSFIWVGTSPNRSSADWSIWMLISVRTTTDRWRMRSTSSTFKSFEEAHSSFALSVVDWVSIWKKLKSKNLSWVWIVWKRHSFTFSSNQLQQNQLVLNRRAKPVQLWGASLLRSDPNLFRCFDIDSTLCSL